MKHKITKHYVDNLINRVLSEAIQERADEIVSKIKENITEKESCEQCGVGEMVEGICEQCGYKMEGIHDVYDLDNKNEFDYVQEEDDIETMDEPDSEEDSVKGNEDACNYHMKNFGPNDERTKKYCKSNTIKDLARRPVPMNEKLVGNQNKLDKNKNNKLDTEDFRLLRQSKKRKFDFYEGTEVGEGNAFTGALVNAKKEGKNSFKIGGKKYDVKENEKPVNEKLKGKGKSKVSESLKLTESEMIELIESIVIEQKNRIKGLDNVKGLNVYKKAHKGSGKENKDYLKSVAEKMKDYLKDGSKGKYETEPKHFPKGNGELSKMDKMAYIPSNAVKDYTDNLTAAGLENLDYDEIRPNEEWVENNVVGSSKTGNNSEWANSVETDVNKKRNEVRKKNLLGKIKKKAYNKSAQPIITDRTGKDGADSIFTKLESTNEKPKEKLNEEFERMKSLISYTKKTQ
jgi:hypothetical protein